MRARLVFLLSLSLASCNRTQEAPIGPTPESAASVVADAGSEHASGDAAATNASTCNHLHPNSDPQRTFRFALDTSLLIAEVPSNNSTLSSVRIVN